MNEQLASIQIISTFRPTIGGAQRATENLSRGLIRQGCDTQVLTSWRPGLGRVETVHSVPVRRLGTGGSVKLGALSFGLHAFYWILRHCRSIPIIHTQNIDTPLLVGMLLKVIGRKHWVVTIQGEPPIFAKHHTLFGRLRLRSMRRLADHFIAITEENEKVLLEDGIPAQQISRIPNSVDTDYFRPPRSDERQALRAQYGYDLDDTIVLYMGRLIFRKRVDLLLRAFARQSPASGVHCIVGGGGEETEKLQALTRELRLGSRVQFQGPVDNVRDFYWLSDIFVLPSRFEGLPVALLESMACGMAVLVSRCPGNLQVVKDKVNGLTCGIDDLSELSDCLKTLIKDRNLRSALGTEARSSISTEYSITAVSAAHLRVYNKILGHSVGGVI